jgi:glucokinase
MKEIICVDLGGTKTRCGIFDIASSIPKHVSIVATPRHKTGEDVLTKILDGIRTYFEGTDVTAAIVVGAPGPLDIEKGIVIDAPLFQNFHNVPILSTIQDEFKVPTFVQNDANLAALGEYKYGAGAGSTTMIYLTVSTGVGGGIVINDQLLTGSRGFAAEPGHICIYPNGNLCGCGHRGCLEAYASGSAIESEAYRVVHQGVKTELLSVFNEKGKIQVEDIVRLANSGDSVSKNILIAAGSYIGIGLSSLVNVFNPDKIVLGGGVSNAGKLLLDPIKDKIATQALFPMSEQVTVSSWVIGDEAGLRGAYAYGLQQLGNEL